MKEKILYDINDVNFIFNLSTKYTFKNNFAIGKLVVNCFPVVRRTNPALIEVVGRDKSTYYPCGTFDNHYSVSVMDAVEKLNSCSYCLSPEQILFTRRELISIARNLARVIGKEAESESDFPKVLDVAEEKE